MNQRGFTLIELMVTVSILAILGSIALPSYQEYVRRQRLAVAKQEMMVIVGELERFKSKNFTYKGFTLGTVYNDATLLDKINVPINHNTKHYTIELVDTSDNNFPVALDHTNALGYSWAMIAVRSDASRQDRKNYDLLMLSTGARCQTKDFNQVASYTGCGSNSEAW